MRKTEKLLKAILTCTFFCIDCWIFLIWILFLRGWWFWELLCLGKGKWVASGRGLTGGTEGRRKICWKYLNCYITSIHKNFVNFRFWIAFREELLLERFILGMGGWYGWEHEHECGDSIYGWEQGDVTYFFEMEGGGGRYKGQTGGRVSWEMEVGVPFTNYYDKFTLKYFAESGILLKDIPVLTPNFCCSFLQW